MRRRCHAPTGVLAGLLPGAGGAGRRRRLRACFTPLLRDWPPATRQRGIVLDYNPSFPGRAPAVMILGALTVRTAMLSFNAVAEADRREFAIHLLIRIRT